MRIRNFNSKFLARNSRAIQRLALFPFFFGLLLFATLYSVHGAAANTNRVIKRLSLEDCIRLGLDHSLRAQIERDSSIVARYTLQASEALYEPVFSLSGSTRFVDYPAEFDPKKVGNDAEYEEVIVSFGPSVSGRLPMGLLYQLGSLSSYDHARSIVTTNIFDPNLLVPFQTIATGVRTTNAWFNVTGVALSQPLLKNFWIDIYRRDAIRAQLNLQIAQFAFQTMLLTTATDVELAYYELLTARETLRLQINSFDLANRLANDVQAQVKAGSLTDLDYQQALSSVESAKSRVVEAEGQYRIQQNNLKNLLSERPGDWSNIDIEPSDPLQVSGDTPELQQVWSDAMTRRPELLSARAALKVSEVAVRYAYNQLFPALNLTGSYGWYVFDESFSGHLDQLRHGANAFYSAGAILSFPLGNGGARNTYKMVKQFKKEAELRVRLLEQQIMSEIESGLQAQKAAYEQIQATKRAREYAQGAVTAQEQLFRAGLTNSYAVLTFQRNLTSNYTAEVQAVANYNKSQARLLKSRGTGLEEHNIKVNVH